METKEQKTTPAAQQFLPAPLLRYCTENAWLDIVDGKLPKACWAQGQRVPRCCGRSRTVCRQSVIIFVDEIKWVNVGRLGEIIDSLKSVGVKMRLWQARYPSLFYRTG